MKIYLDTIGCRLNQAEIEMFASQFRANGHEIVAVAGEADLAVINTCTVTGQAAADSRAAIRRARRQGVRQILCTGCWVTMEPETAILVGADRLVPNQQKDTLVADLLELSPDHFNQQPSPRQPLPGQHARTRAFIKAQDGCDLACTYCITTIARGRSRSRLPADIIKDIQAALDGGARDIILTGVHLGAWGKDFEPSSNFPDLVRTVLNTTSLERLRLSSLEPWDISAGFFELWVDHRLCRHLHLPLQSGSADVLSRMGRRTSPGEFSSLIASAREDVPGIAITTDVIAGFPGETDREFQETVAFIRSIGLAGGHVFPFSPMEGTLAARMSQQVPDAVRKERSAVLRDIFAGSVLEFRSKFLGKTMSVLWEGAEPVSEQVWKLQGLTDNYLRVEALSSAIRWNQLDNVKMIGLTRFGLRGEIC